MGSNTRNTDADFDTLTGIMKRYCDVPFDQFQKELTDHFDRNFPDSYEELSEYQQKAMIKFKEDIMGLANDLFIQADLIQQCQDIIK